MSKSILAERTTGTTDKDLSEGAAAVVAQNAAARKAGAEPKKGWGEKLRESLPNKPEPKAAKKQGGATAGAKAFFAFKAGALRVANVLFAMVLLQVTAMQALPLLAMWLHQELAAMLGAQPSIQGSLALWLIPLAFLAAAILVGEIALIKAFWRFGSKKISAMKTAIQPVEAASAHKAANGRQASKNKRK